MAQGVESVDPEQVKQFIHQDAEARAEAMKTAIEDQLVNIKYRETMRGVIHSGNLYGTGVLKGPLINRTSSKRWFSQGNDSALVELEKLSPYIEFVPVWDIYPDMQADTMEDAQYIFQRYSYSRADLVALAKRPDFNTKAIKKYIKAFPDGNAEKETFETELMTMGDDDSGLIQDNRKRYELTEFWGYADADLLRDAGVLEPGEEEDEEELTGEVFANVWLLGDVVIKAVPAPIEGVEYPYYFYFYDKDETSFFGEGIASVMRDTQQLFNSSVRQMLDNSAICAGPIFEVNLDLLADDEDPTDIHPFRVFMRHGDGVTANAPAVRSYSVNSHTQEYLQLAELFSRYADETTAIPRYLQGQAQGSTAGAGRTASGLSMMFGAANIMLKDQVRHFDDGVTKPFITNMYHWNMQFNDDPAIKGDMSIEALGSSSLVAKEVHTERLSQLMQGTANPMDAPLFKRSEMWRDVLKYFDLNSNYLRTEEEVQQMQMEQTATQEAARVQEVIKDSQQQGVPLEQIYMDLLQGVDPKIVLGNMGQSNGS
jgi:hypothetical protein